MHSGLQRVYSAMEQPMHVSLLAEQKAVLMVPAADSLLQELLHAVKMTAFVLLADGVLPGSAL